MNTIWYEVTLDDGTKILMNFDQVIAIAARANGESGSVLITAAREFRILETREDLQSALPI